MGSYCSTPSDDSFDAKYRLGELLGRGSQGSVHTCTSRETTLKCAVKMIDRRVRNSWATFRREVDLCRAAAKCPHIVTIVDEFVDQSYCYVVMDKYASHLRKTLKIGSKQYRRGTGLENPVLRRVVLQATSALAFVHNVEIIHRDVKAQNFLVDRTSLHDPQCRVVLSDFGLARELPFGRTLNAQVGTRKYWAPDLYNKKYSHNVDVFAVGVLIFLAASGTYPYNDEDQVLKRDIFAEDMVPDILSSEARDFMWLCLQKDPFMRPGAGDLLSHIWLRAPPSLFCSQEESITLSNEGSDTESTAAPSPASGALASSPFARPSKSPCLRLGRKSVPQRDATHYLEASDIIWATANLQDMSEDVGSNGVTTVCGAECSSPQTDFLQSASIE